MSRSLDRLPLGTHAVASEALNVFVPAAQRKPLISPISQPLLLKRGVTAHDRRQCQSAALSCWSFSPPNSPGSAKIRFGCGDHAARIRDGTSFDKTRGIMIFDANLEKLRQAEREANRQAEELRAQLTAAKKAARAASGRVTEATGSRSYNAQALYTQQEEAGYTSEHASLSYS